jgi:hypothetical protein
METISSKNNNNNNSSSIQDSWEMKKMDTQLLTSTKQ